MDRIQLTGNGSELNLLGKIREITSKSEFLIINDLIEQHPDKNIIPFSFINRDIHISQISCFITHTNKKTHKIIAQNLNLSPMYSGKIQSS